MGTAEHFDVLIVGAGLSGIGAACHLQAQLPGKRYAILEARDALGGTWDLFRYPGIRSDSDMHTLGYAFRPWTNAKAIADGPAILEYVRDTAREHGVDRHIRYGRRVTRASWDSAQALWTVETEQETLTCRFLSMCTGYYRYDEGYTPPLPGIERFAGTVVHPQHWPADLDHAGKRVVVIGSGATAITLVPAMASDAAHVTMLQRSPSYIVAMPAKDPIAQLLRRRLPERTAYGLTRWKNVISQAIFFRVARRRPALIREVIRRWNARELPGWDLARDFRPRYNPWDQRICLAPDGDLFAALRSGRASVVTDTIETFTETGIALTSGKHLDADIVVTATGLNLLMLGGAELCVDGEPVDISKRLVYKGLMLDGVPNLSIAVGYTNASWTLKADLTSEYTCRLLAHLDETGHDYCVPRNRDPHRETVPVIDFNSSYVLRDIGRFPKQGTEHPWRVHQNYLRDILMFRRGSLEDDAMEFCDASARDGAPRGVGAAATAGADAR